MTPDKFVENFSEYAKRYPPETVQADLDKILAIKGLKRQDVPSLQKILQRWNPNLHKWEK